MTTCDLHSLTEPEPEPEPWSRHRTATVWFSSGERHGEFWFDSGHKELNESCVSLSWYCFRAPSADFLLCCHDNSYGHLRAPTRNTSEGHFHSRLICLFSDEDRVLSWWFNSLQKTIKSFIITTLNHTQCNKPGTKCKININKYKQQNFILIMSLNIKLF